MALVRSPKALILDLKCVTDTPTHGKNHLEHVQASALGHFGPCRAGPPQGRTGLSMHGSILPRRQRQTQK